MMLCFLSISSLFILSCGGGGGGTAAVSKYAQTDLEGTWNFHLLEAGVTNGWSRGPVTINAAGTLSFDDDDFESSSGGSAPAGPIVWTINAFSGVITERNNGAATSAHYTMTSNNNLIAGTATGSSMLFVGQRKVAGVSYSNADLRNKSLVWHGLYLEYDGSHKWVYGTGSTDANGLYTGLTEVNALDGSVSPGSGATFSVNSEGVVTISGDTYWKGFLSADKKTVVATGTTDHGGGNLTHSMMILQITGKAYSAGPLPAATWNAHGLVVGEGSSAPLWIRYLATVNSSGTISLGSVESNQSGISFVIQNSYPGGTLSGSGLVTFDGDTSNFHGQLSDDETFMVATQTPYTEGSDGYHSLTIYTDIR